MRTLKKLIFILVAYSACSFGEVFQCFKKNEVGEMSQGSQYIFDRIDQLDRTNPSVIDYDKLKIINADTGNAVSIKIVGKNLYASLSGYNFLTNDDRSVLMEIKFSKSIDIDLVFSKILFCEKKVAVDLAIPN